MRPGPGWGQFIEQFSMIDNIRADIDSAFEAGIGPQFVRGIGRFCPENNYMNSFLSDRNKRRTTGPIEGESTRTQHLFDDEDLGQTIIPWEQTHYPTQDLIRTCTFGSTVEIRPSLVTFSQCQSLPNKQPKFGSWLEYPSKIESEDTFIYLGCDEYTAAVIFNGWERLGNEYNEKVSYRKQNKILKLICEFALMVIKYENVFNQNISRPLGLATEEICKKYDPNSGRYVMTDHCPPIGWSHSRLVDKAQEEIRATAAQRTLFELKASELKGIHQASILRVLQAQLGVGTVEFKEARRHYLVHSLPSAIETTTIAHDAIEAYLKAFLPRRFLRTSAKIGSDDQKESDSRCDSGYLSSYRGPDDKQSHNSTFDRTLKEQKGKGSKVW